MTFSGEKVNPYGYGFRGRFVYGKHVCAVYFDARSLYGRAYGPKGNRWLWPSVRDASGYQAMWIDFLGAIESGRRIGPRPAVLRRGQQAG